MSQRRLLFRFTSVAWSRALRLAWNGMIWDFSCRRRSEGFLHLPWVRHLSVLRALVSGCGPPGMLYQPLHRVIYLHQRCYSYDCIFIYSHHGCWWCCMVKRPVQLGVHPSTRDTRCYSGVQAFWHARKCTELCILNKFYYLNCKQLQTEPLSIYIYISVRAAVVRALFSAFHPLTSGLSEV